jgi:transcriptional regulator with XRE-family HTH domain
MGAENMSKTVNIGRKLKGLRERMGLKQSQIAEFLDVDQSLVSKFEKDERQINVDMLERLCGLFGCSISYFFEDAELKNLEYAMMSNNIKGEDLESIAEINRIAMNIRQMKDLLTQG